MSVNTKVNGQLVKSAGLYKASVPIQSGDIYSEQERQVGVWTDGKPLYQKTYNVTFSSDAYAITIPSEIDIKTIIGGVDSANKTDFIHIGYGGGSSDSVQAYRTDATTLRFQNKYYSQRPNGEITLQYTKTTDVAGSGEYVPSGDKAVHYSTEEQVIGTWIDGKTLYRRTITGLSIQLNGTTWVNYNPSISIDKLINVHAYYEPSGGLMTCAIAEYQYNSSVGIQLTAVQGYNRTVNILTIEYTKTS